MKIIQLTKDMITLVDDHVYEVIKDMKWYANDAGKAKGKSRCYARRGGGGSPMISMHDYIMEHCGPDRPLPGMTADHIDPHRTLDNRLCNLRWATRAQQEVNKPPSAANKTGLKGVVKRGGRFRVYMRLEQKPYYLGTYSTAEDAGAVYDYCATYVHGTHVYLNLPDRPLRLPESARTNKSVQRFLANAEEYKRNLQARIDAHKAEQTSGTNRIYPVHPEHGEGTA